jgi:hypothetical protein
MGPRAPSFLAWSARHFHQLCKALWEELPSALHRALRVSSSQQSPVPAWRPFEQEQQDGLFKTRVTKAPETSEPHPAGTPIQAIPANNVPKPFTPHPLRWLSSLPAFLHTEDRDTDRAVDIYLASL